MGGAPPRKVSAGQAKLLSRTDPVDAARISNCCDVLFHLDRNYLPAQFIAVADLSLYLDFTATEGVSNLNEAWDGGSRAMRMLEFDSQPCTSYALCIAGSNYKQS
jgi:hypothetical protein